MYVGVDLHERMAVYAAMDGNGKVVTKGEIENNVEGWKNFAQAVGPGSEVAMEAILNWGQMHDLLESFGVRPVVANSKQVRMIAESRNKRPHRQRGPPISSRVFSSDGSFSHGRKVAGV